MKISNKIKMLLGIILAISVIFMTTSVFAVDDPLLDMNEFTGNKPNTETTDNVDDLTFQNNNKDNNANNANSLNNNTQNSSIYDNELANAGASDIAFIVISGIAIFTVIGIVAFKKMDDYKNI